MARKAISSPWVTKYKGYTVEDMDDGTHAVFKDGRHQLSITTLAEAKAEINKLVKGVNENE